MPAPFHDHVRVRVIASGLVDRREDNGDRKVTEEYIRILRWVLTMGPQDFGHRRPTWTQPLLVEAIA